MWIRTTIRAVCASAAALLVLTAFASAQDDGAVGDASSDTPVSTSAEVEVDADADAARDAANQEVEDAADAPSAAAPRTAADAPRYFAEPTPEQQRAAELFDAGVAAWREGRHARAEELWLETLRVIGPPVEATASDQVLFDRHALLHDLGNAAYRAGRHLEAVGWYEAALRHRPRHAATRSNLELAERAAGLERADGSSGTAEAWAAYLELWTPAEARWLALLGLVPLAIALLVEAVRGGRAAVLWAVASLCLAVVLVAPHANHRAHEDASPHLVIAEGGAIVHAEARAAATGVGRVEPGDLVERVDALPDWIRVETRDGANGWVRKDALFALRR